MKYVAIFDVDEKMFNSMTKEEVNNMILNDPNTEAILQNKGFTVSVFDRAKVKELPLRRMEEGRVFADDKKYLRINAIKAFAIREYQKGWNACIEEILGEDK